MHDDPRLFRNKYVIRSTRLRGWDYRNPGWYFVTICTKGRYPWFGEIREKAMHMSDMGKMADAYWRSIPHHFHHVLLDDFVIMPDHLHGIIVLQKSNNTNMRAPLNVKMCDFLKVETCDSLNVETCDSHVSTAGESKHIPRPMSGTLGSIINQFKSICTKHIRNAGHADFAWQPRFHDHVIRSEDELIRIRKYIHNNPLQLKDEDAW